MESKKFESLFLRFGFVQIFSLDLRRCFLVLWFSLEAAAISGLESATIVQERSISLCEGDC